MSIVSSRLNRRRFVLAATGSAVGMLAAPSILRAAGEINLYSSRHYDTDEALYANFTKETGIAINRIEAKADQLIERMKAEGENSPADVLISVDAGRIERANTENLLQPIQSEVLSSRIPTYLRHSDGSWFGFSKRARVLIIAKDRMDPKDATSYEGLTADAMKGRVLIRSSGNIYNQSLMGSIIAANGADGAAEWAKGMVANFARSPKGGDTDQIMAVAAGEGDIAVANSYYLGKMFKSGKEDRRKAAEKVTLVFPNQGDRGTHVNISGGGVARHAKNKDGAVKFLEYLASDKAQEYFAAGNVEYPVVKGVPL
ncbi:MAG: extracellular solute-binding protein, partial [Pseudomonadota bacterium]